MAFIVRKSCRDLEAPPGTNTEEYGLSAIDGSVGFSSKVFEGPK
jgi:hypothetical protein